METRNLTLAIGSVSQEKEVVYINSLKFIKWFRVKRKIIV